MKYSRKIQQGSSGPWVAEKERKKKTSGEEMSERKKAEERREELQVHSIDQFRFMGNYPHTPPLTQHYHLLLTYGKMLG